MSLTNAFSTQPNPGTNVPPGVQIPVLATNTQLPPDVVLNQPATAGRKRSAEEMMNGSVHPSVDDVQLKMSETNGANVHNGIMNNGLIEPCILDDNETPEVTEFVK